MRIVGWVTIYAGVTWLLLLATGWTHTLWGDLTLAAVTIWSVGLWLGFMNEYHNAEDYRELWRLLRSIEAAYKKLSEREKGQ